MNRTEHEKFATKVLGIDTEIYQEINEARGTTVRIDIRGNNTEAPLYFSYPGQCNLQPAYIEYTGHGDGDADIVLVADYSGEIGGGIPANVNTGVVRRWSVPPQVARWALINLIEDDEFLGLLDRLHAGFSVEHDGSNWVGELTDDAAEAEVEIIEILADLADLECVEIFDARDWCEAGTDFKTLVAAGSVEALATEMIDACDGNQMVDGGHAACCNAIGRIIESKIEGLDSYADAPAGVIFILVAFDSDLYKYLADEQ